LKGRLSRGPYEGRGAFPAFVRTCFGRVRVEVEGHPGGGELVVGARVQLLVGADGLVELLLADVTPGAHGIADRDDLERGHGTRYRHTTGRGAASYMGAERGEFEGKSTE
jgi:hypothetical protein